MAPKKSASLPGALGILPVDQFPSAFQSPLLLEFHCPTDGGIPAPSRSASSTNEIGFVAGGVGDIARGPISLGVPVPAAVGVPLPDGWRNTSAFQVSIIDERDRLRCRGRWGYCPWTNFPRRSSPRCCWSSIARRMEEYQRLPGQHHRRT